MTKAVIEILSYGFGLLQLHSVEARIHPENIGSENVLLSTGFIKEAYFKENFLLNGIFEDTAVYSKLASTHSL